MADKLASLELPDGRSTESVEPAPLKRSLLSHLPFRRRHRGRHPSNTGRSDWAVTISGIGIAAACALFPWYIFFNQEQFGIAPLKFSDREPQSPISSVVLPQLVGSRMPARISEQLPLDLTATGTIDTRVQEAPSDQPFPGDRFSFRLVHAGHGRAMIEDSGGYWVVQRGSALPDGSTVSSIERRGDSWVIVTSSNEVISMAAR